MIIELEYQFSAGHFYQVKEWSAEKNTAEFGLCFNPWGHGHNYRFLVQFKGLNQFTEEEILNFNKICQSVTNQLEHRHLNHEITEFKKIVPTTENIAVYLAKKIASQTDFLHKLILFEMKNLWVEVSWTNEQ